MITRPVAWWVLRDSLGQGKEPKVPRRQIHAHTACPLKSLSSHFTFCHIAGTLVAFNILIQVSGTRSETNLTPEKSWGSKMVIGLRGLRADPGLFIDCELEGFTYIV